jgi:four helix bundle protein
MEPLFDHERLDVYHVARAFNRQVGELVSELPRGHAESRDNLRRAAKSIARNIAEGSGKWTVPDKVRFYQIARASATECAAALDELVDHALLAEDRTRPTKELLARIVAMLIAMIRALEARGKDMGTPPPS